VQTVLFIHVLLKVCCANSFVYSSVAKSLLCKKFCLSMCCSKFVVQIVLFILVLLNVCCANSFVYSCVAKSLLCKQFC
jgi:hypothetical protein